ncbi:MAG: hypothetical protein ACLFNY_04625, partial [Candidatus Aenigmatarchaeota archaeon]
YTTMVVALFFSGIFISIPAAVFLIDRLVGLIAMLLVLVMSAGIFMSLVIRAGIIYERMEVDL